MVAIGTATVAARAIGAVFPAEHDLLYTLRLRGDDEIYRMDVRHRIAVNLSKTVYWRNNRFDSQDRAPAWSPDGRRIAFHSNRYGNDDLFVMSATGRDVVRLTDYIGTDIQPSWSPDGCCVVYQSFRETDYELIRLNITTNESVALTDDSATQNHPAYSPDGTRIVFSSNQDNSSDNFRLFTMNPDGGDVQRLARLDGGQDALHPSYSPDGRYVIFDNAASGVGRFFYIVPTDGSVEPQRLIESNGRREYYFPVWLADGRSVGYVAADANGSDIYAATFAPPNLLTHPRPITQQAGAETQPDFKPRPR
jgi:Tol biopolymer transport system component